jgi:hypothetical protein
MTDEDTLRRSERARAQERVEYRESSMVLALALALALAALGWGGQRPGGRTRASGRIRVCRPAARR